jgi:hypothetical protein
MLYYSVKRRPMGLLLLPLHSLLTVQLLTQQGTRLTLHLAAIPRLPAGHPQPIVEFRYLGGILCSSYYLSTFLEVSSGLCLQGGTDYRQDIDAATVGLCKDQCAAWLQECGLKLQQH